MADAIRTPKADLDYAERVVRKGFATPEQAAQIFGVELTQLVARLAAEPQPNVSGDLVERNVRTRSEIR